MRQALLTVDLGFGDAGKGAIVDLLTRTYQAHTVVRFNGGAQAGHRVVAPDGREHVFSQFGSGTLAGAATHLSRFMLLDPLAMLGEEQHLRQLGIRDAFARTTIDERALVITPFARAINRLRELARGAGRHGSCGMGIGETMVDALNHGQRALFAGDLRDRDVLREKLDFLRAVNLAKLDALRPQLPDTQQVAEELALLADDWHTWVVDAYAEFAPLPQIVPGDRLHALLRIPGAIVFEAAQGALLDEWRGFHPYTTWSTTTLANAETLLREAGYTGEITRVGITRAYATRHGAGPLPTEDAALTAALPDARNGFGAWQHGFRVGALDLVLLRYALEIVGPLDQLAVTCLDRLADLPHIPACRAYEVDGGSIERLATSPVLEDLAYQERQTELLLRVRPIVEQLPDEAALLELLASELGVPVGITSHGPSADQKHLIIESLT